MNMSHDKYSNLVGMGKNNCHALCNRLPGKYLTNNLQPILLLQHLLILRN